LDEALRAMAERIENPLSIRALAARAGVSARQLKRLFLRYARVSPARANC
jgi:transcriptional regulator GlxA family with amidase domain